MERERRDERVEGAEEGGEGCAVRKGSKEVVAEVGAAIEGVWKVEFGGDTDAGPDLDVGINAILWASTCMYKGIRDN